MRTLIKNGKLVDFENRCFIIRDILIEGERILRVDRNLRATGTERVIDARDLYVSPGFIDAHVHLREPGFSHKETVRTGTRACARGGFTHVFSMPNTSPSPDSIAHLEAYEQLLEEQAIIQVTPVASVTVGLKGDQRSDWETLSKRRIAGFSDDGRPVQAVGDVFGMLRLSKRTGKALMTHSEDLETFEVGAVNRGPVSQALGVDGIPNEAESNMIARDIEILRQAGGHLHICHVSTKESIAMIRQAKLEGLNITCEVAPHHLSLTEEEVLRVGPLAKVNPPLRARADVEAILEGIQDGTVDMIATDHAPHEMSSKKGDITKASYGFSGSEIAFPIAYTYLIKKRRVINLIELIRLMSYNPARIFGLDDEGRVEPGALANLVLLDLSQHEAVDVTQWRSKGKNSPFDGMMLYGKVARTIYRGETVYEEGNDGI